MYKLYKRLGEGKFQTVLSAIALLIQFNTTLAVMSLAPNTTGLNISIAITVGLLALVPATMLILEYKQLREKWLNSDE